MALRSARMARTMSPRIPDQEAARHPSEVRAGRLDPPRQGRPRGSRGVLVRRPRPAERLGRERPGRRATQVPARSHRGPRRIRPAPAIRDQDRTRPDLVPRALQARTPRDLGPGRAARAEATTRVDRFVVWGQAHLQQGSQPKALLEVAGFEPASLSDHLGLLRA